MAWTDYSNTVPSAWDAGIGQVVNSIGSFAIEEGIFDTVNFATNNTYAPYAVGPNFLDNSYNIPGFDDGYQPSSTPDPIDNNISEGGGSPPDPGGGSTRPTSGMLYPRGQG